MKQTSDKPKRMPFCAEMVPKVLDGSKTQTRRIGGLKEINQRPDTWAFEGFSADGALFESGGKVFQCPPRYYVGDIICISEAWATLENHDNVPPRLLPEFIPLRYLSNDDIRCGEIDKFSCRRFGKHRPSMFQPIWACRPWRGRITDVRCERVLGISEEDALAEGFYAPEAFWAKIEQLNDIVAENYWVFAYTWGPISEEGDR